MELVVFNDGKPFNLRQKGNPSIASCYRRVHLTGTAPTKWMHRYVAILIQPNAKKNWRLATAKCHNISAFFGQKCFFSKNASLHTLSATRNWTVLILSIILATLHQHIYRAQALLQVAEFRTQFQTNVNYCDKVRNNSEVFQKLLLLRCLHVSVCMVHIVRHVIS